MASPSITRLLAYAELAGAPVDKETIEQLSVRGVEDYSEYTESVTEVAESVDCACGESPDVTSLARHVEEYEECNSLREDDEAESYVARDSSCHGGSSRPEVQTETMESVVEVVEGITVPSVHEIAEVVTVRSGTVESVDVHEAAAASSDRAPVQESSDVYEVTEDAEEVVVSDHSASVEFVESRDHQIMTEHKAFLTAVPAALCNSGPQGNVIARRIISREVVQPSSPALSYQPSARSLSVHTSPTLAAGNVPLQFTAASVSSIDAAASHPGEGHVATAAEALPKAVEEHVAPVAPLSEGIRYLNTSPFVTATAEAVVAPVEAVTTTTMYDAPNPTHEPWKLPQSSVESILPALKENGGSVAPSVQGSLIRVNNETVLRASRASMLSAPNDAMMRTSYLSVPPSERAGSTSAVPAEYIAVRGVGSRAGSRLSERKDTMSRSDASYVSGMVKTFSRNGASCTNLSVSASQRGGGVTKKRSRCCC